MNPLFTTYKQTIIMKNLFLNFKTSENENILVKMLSFSLSKPNVLRGWHRNEGKTILSTEYYT